MLLTRRRAFTLVELLVVIGIIAILMALFMGAVMWGVNAARRARMSTEIAAIHEAIEKYKTKTGDYPPNFRDYNAVVRHIRTRFPRIAPAEFNALIAVAWGPSYSMTSPPPAGAVPLIDEGEALVAWLARTRNDPVYPFGLATTTPGAYQTYYEFDERRLVDGPDPDLFPSYRAAFANDTFYLYIDSRSYDEIAGDPVYAAGPVASTGAFAELDTSTPAAIALIAHEQVVRPYANDAGTAFINPTSFQILCAGQDGDWGNVDPLDGFATARKGYPGGLNYSPGDNDNITNFSEGGTLEDKLP
jgi:prepilin-type N-terminal cleavage/methylation domain-containing protein